MAEPLRVHQGEKGRRCPACRREVNPARRHKTTPRYGTWCDGQPRPERDAALNALADVHDVLTDLYFEHRFAEVLTLAQPLLERAGRKVRRG